MVRPFSLLRRSTGIATAILLVMLVGTASANFDTINTAAGIQFSGVVDSFPSCTPGSASINWGDSPTTSAGSIDSSGNVSGSHIYANPGTFNGTVTLTGGQCAAGAVHNDTFTANVA